VAFLKELTDTAVWLGGEQLVNRSFAWDDGSEFNYSPWFPGEPDCQSESCCGIFLTRKNRKLALQNCDHSNMHVVCQIAPPSRLSEMTKRDFMKIAVDGASEKFRPLEKQLKELNESTIARIEEQHQKALNYSDERTRILTEKIDKIVKDFKGTIDSLERLVFKNLRRGVDSNRVD